ncbi:MAG: DUF2089 family protein, partial [Acetivibrio sp.]
KLTCHHCGLELSNDFTLNKFSFLSQEELAFVECFLFFGGNLKGVQKQLHLSYPAAKKRLSQVQEHLGLKPEEEEKILEPTLKKLPLYRDESSTVRKIKEKLNRSGGIATLPLPKGEPFQIYYEDYGNGILATNLPHSRTLTWSAFDYAVTLLEKNGGKAAKGNAMKGKLGSAGLPLDSLEGYVAYHAYHIKKGESCLRTISSLSAILEWAGLCKNGYGYVELL